jgi:DUF1680 family protein
MYWDSDLGKWIEAAAYTLAAHRDPALEGLIDDVVDRIARAQEPDGYFNSYFQRRAPQQRFTNLRDWHELYCAGHLIEGAVAYAAATGKRRLLDVMCRYADLVARSFGTGPGMKRGYCGHEEIELALVTLYRFSGERRYLDLARYFVNERGRQPHYFEGEARERGEAPDAWYHKTFEYNQAHRPVREQDKVVGHAVRATYLYSAMADITAEDGDAALRAASEWLWDGPGAVQRRGQRHFTGATASFTRTGLPAAAAWNAGPGIAARLTSHVSSHLSGNTSPLRPTMPCRCTSIPRARVPRGSVTARSNGAVWRRRWKGTAV